jgi:hypothetical protein
MRSPVEQPSWRKNSSTLYIDVRIVVPGPMTMADGTGIPPANKSFKVDFCTVAHWNEKGEILEENLFYDLMGMLKQIGVM